MSSRQSKPIFFTMGLLSHSVVAACAALLAVTFTSPPPGLQPVVAQLKRHAYDTFAPPVGHRWNAHKVSLSQYNNKWDGSVPSVLTISSGECVEIHSVRAGVHTSCSRSCELLRPPALLKEPNATRVSCAARLCPLQASTAPRAPPRPALPTLAALHTPHEQSWLCLKCRGSAPPYIVT